MVKVEIKINLADIALSDLDREISQRLAKDNSAFYRYALSYAKALRHTEAIDLIIDLVEYMSLQNEIRVNRKELSDRGLMIGDRHLAGIGDFRRE